MTETRLITPQFVLLGSAALAYFFADGVLVPSVPLYVTGPLTGGDAAVGIAVGAFSVSALLLRPWAGRLADRRGRAVAMVGGGLVFAASVACYSLAEAVWALVALRLLTGVGEAFFFVGTVTAMSDLAPAARRGEAISLFSLSLYAGLAVGPPVGEKVIAVLGFGTVWTVSTGAALLAVLLAWRVGETREPGTAEPGGRLIHPAAVLPAVLLLALIWGMAGFLAFVPLYALEVGLSGAGVVLFLFAGIVIVIRSVGAQLPDRLGAVRAVRLALFCTAAGSLVIGSWRTAPGLVCGTMVLAIGIALGTPSIMVLALRNAPAAERGAVMGTVSMSLDVALGLGPAMFGVVATATDRGTGFLAAAVVAGCGLALAGARLTGTGSGVALEAPPTSGPVATPDARSEQAGHRPVSAS